MRVLNLFAGLGGNRRFWDKIADISVTAVELDLHIADAYAFAYPKDTLIVGDAYEYAAKHYDEFDFIWASPPCQTHSRLNTSNIAKISSRKLPDFQLYSLISYMQKRCRTKWVVENVVPYYTPLIAPSVTLSRHIFWSNFEIKKAKFESKKPLSKIVISDFNEFDLSRFKGIKNKRQAVRNCVDAKLGKYIFECFLKAINDNQTTHTH